jgi:hypothetical protein
MAGCAVGVIDLTTAERCGRGCGHCDLFDKGTIYTTEGLQSGIDFVVTPGWYGVGSNGKQKG